VTGRQWLVLGNATAFLLYGGSLLVSSAMIVEFERFGLSRWRVLTGVLEVLGGLGLLVGLRVPSLQRAAALGLCLLMVLGVAARVRSRDTLWQLAPALLLGAINGALFRTPALPR
jgi:hypothetical protein